MRLKEPLTAHDFEEWTVKKICPISYRPRAQCRHHLEKEAQPSAI